MDSSIYSPSPKRGFNRYSMTPDSVSHMKKAEQWHYILLKKLDDEFPGKPSISYQDSKNFLDSTLSSSGVEFDEEILESIFK